MASTGIRNLKNNLSRYLRKLKPGQVIAITDRGRVIAELRSTPVKEGLPATPLAGGYARLLAAGVIRQAPERGDPLPQLTTRGGGVAPAGLVADLIGEDRGS